MTFHTLPTRTSSRIVRQFFDIAIASDDSLGAIARRTGVHRDTLSYWKSGHRAPSLTDFENAAQALGYRLELVKE